MKIINDTLKSRGKWSTGRLTMLVAFAANIIYAGYATYKTGALPDLPANWLGLITLMYGINKAGQCALASKGAADA